MLRLLLIAAVIIPNQVLSQSLQPAVEAGYGVTASRERSGEAAHAQVSAALYHIGNIALRAEGFYQEGTVGGAGKCSQLSAQYCIGTSDRNRIAALSGSLHVPLGTRGRFTAYVPLGLGVYHRRTRTTETEGPIALCTVNGQVVPCEGNPPLRSVTYNTDATTAGYNVGVGLLTTISRLSVFVEMRAHDMLESDSRAGAVPFSIGIRF